MKIGLIGAHALAAQGTNPGRFHGNGSCWVGALLKQGRLPQHLPPAGQLQDNFLTILVYPETGQIFTVLVKQFTVK